MIDPVLRLAVAMHSSKGVYALLLGSGVSRSSAIPTGWEVILDLIRKLAHMKGEDCEHDSEAWYKTLTGSEPDYSDILDQLTMSSAERAQLLRSYFEPTEDESEQGRKAPSPAHRAIATLVSKGYVRVIVTTNFDRLMEHALTDVGVQASVISTVDGTQGALPLTHSRCTIIKIHGDYLDQRIKNTRLELAAYEKSMNDLLDRVLDEYGLLICGWSAEWDFALRAAIERCNTQRFGTYWASRGNLGGEAQKLVALRRGTIIQIADADSFFRDLADKVAALEDLALADPVSAQVAIARMKRYLAAPEQRINLHDLVRAETERVFGEAKSERFSVNDNDLTPESVLRRLRAYEAEMQTLMAIVACGGYWATEEAQFRSIGAAVKRLGDDATPRSGFPVWVSLKKYPALLALYVAGIAAVSNRNYRLLQHLFALRLRTDLQHQPEQSVTEVLTTHETIEHRQQKVLLPGREQQSTPLNNHVFEALRSPLVEYTPDENSYDQAFDTFEYLLGLAHCDATTSDEGLKAAGTPDWYIWGPIGRFAWNHHHSEDHIQKRMHFESGGPCPGMVDGLIQAGMFRSHERLRLVKQGFDVFIAKVRPGIRAW